jgi:RNA polymerase sigma-B factor
MTILHAIWAEPRSSADPNAAKARVDAARLFRSYRERGDQRARQRLITDHLPLVRALARRYARRGEPLDDLVQVGSVGLIKAIDRFEPERGVEFPTYAVPTIAGEIGHYLRDRRTSIRVPSRIVELRSRVARQLDELTQSLGRSPTIGELAAAAKTDVESVVEALEADHVADALPVSTLPSELAPADEAPEHEYELGEGRIDLSSGLKALDRRERHIIFLRFFEDMTQEEVARELGISQVHVSRLLRGAIDKMRTELGA